nr:unnamed protein product [Callosobruchus chinensis]
MSEALGLVVGSLGFNLVYIKTSIYHHRCRAICKDLVDHKRFGKPRTFDAIQKRCRLLATFFLLYCPVSENSVVFFLCLYCLFRNTKKNISMHGGGGIQRRCSSMQPPQNNILKN